MILSIDPGNIESAYAVIDKNLKPKHFGKIPNEELVKMMKSDFFNECEYFAIEMIASYGMAVGKSVFDTCVWIGRFVQIMETDYGLPATFIYRKDEKINLCGTMKAKDSNISQALIDRFDSTSSNRGKGTKKEPGWFYGFSKDVWQAYAVGITHYDMYVKPIIEA